MLCILAFIIFLIFFPILGFFPEYRRLFAKSWACVFNKITLKPCDINLGEELKNKLLGKVMVKFPKLAKFLDKTFTFWAVVFVVVNIWSLVYLAIAGLNLLVYDTCDPVNGESCALGGQACGVNSQKAPSLLETLSRVPDRFKKWEAKDYLAPKPTFYLSEDPNKPYALEVIDPGCQFCAKLTANIKQAELQKRYNLTYVLYPIPEAGKNDGYKFQHSLLRARYLEALKEIQPSESVESTQTAKYDEQVSPDWQVLMRLFTDKGQKQSTLQEEFNTLYSAKEAEEKLLDLIREVRFQGKKYSEEQIQEIRNKANSSEVLERLQKQREIVEVKIRTIKIPTFIFNGRRYDRVIEVNQLRD